ncbi:CLUMA_CG009421, isoform A [Clunio marinus]|uniref:CLUMA_CG009421, isoform A n=1 Tax=Clunio marinus TaxID=568069 RepID=A0A1J1I8T4_9DIPT|nr:CLUMA_CG009421, isoform A [Clunio marinus]
MILTVFGDLSALPFLETSRNVPELSLKLLPPDLARDYSYYDHHHHHHQPDTIDKRTTKTQRVTKPTRTTKPATSTQAVIVEEPKQQQKPFQSNYEKLPDGGYRFSYTTADGQTREELGYFRDNEDGEKIWIVEGFYSYEGADGKPYRVQYIADDKGYRIVKKEPKTYYYYT